MSNLAYKEDNIYFIDFQDEEKKQNKRYDDKELHAKKEYSKGVLKSINDIEKISNVFLNSKGKYRLANLKNYLYFIYGINTILRCSDLLSLKWMHILNNLDLKNNIIEFKEEIVLLEIKTRNTKNDDNLKNRHIFINESMQRATLAYLQEDPDINLSDYIFSNKSTNSNNNKKMTIQAIDEALSKAGLKAGIEFKCNTHMCRRTACYHVYQQGGATDEILHILQKMLNHSSINQTLTYIGIEQETQKEIYLNLNLGLR